ncbi:hypothetical protein BMS3Bbin06_01142 [bacterium BMS3Bbin06]|nr:hypothetical protein BMS3Abin08_01206 [bacterium BMS3Abin08]GBE34613.1 hypothetical protein BMS3Bbin06_01142 [bacterium BMS3Bbin06]
MCPFIDDPINECYCINLNSQTAESVLYYCGGLYRECKIYKKRIGEPEGRVLNV